ncbi:type I-E CRISPR-associated protein Cas6/Cse3/CasE [Xanthobacter sp. V4C-4]|uniref:type I-E CRISPR-associated protein Cas6/Cse3/CasE n=1 Tax=Xanthobacter cornucopiae TaxID=3119924 RepID=UPI003726568A
MRNLLRFDPDLLRCRTWFRQEHLLHRDVEDEGYAWHALLTAAFGRDLAPKPFRVLGRRGRAPQLLAYSAHDGATLAAHADAFCDPLAHQALNIATLAGKPMPAFAAGRRLGFEVRVRPVVRTDGPGGRDSVAERDAYAAACARAGAGPRPDPADVFADWTQARLAAGGGGPRSRPSGSMPSPATRCCAGARRGPAGAARWWPSAGIPPCWWAR